MAAPRQDSAPKASLAWAAAVAAVSLIAIDPRGLGGLRLRGPADPARDRLLAIAKTLHPAGAPFRKLPPGVADARLLGGLDLSATLSAGRPVLERGLLAEADGGTLVIPGAERLSQDLAGKLALALDLGAVSLQRDGFSSEVRTAFAVIACDEALPGEEPPPAALTERLGLMVALSGVSRADLATAAPDPAEVAGARARLPAVRIDDPCVEALAEAAARLGVFGLRPLIFACAAARASAALAGRAEVAEPDLALAARLVLGPRATQAPAAPEEGQSDEAPPDEPDDADAPSDAAPPDDEGAGDPREMTERVLEAAAAALPKDLLAAIAGGAAPKTPSRAPGRAGAARASKRRGRPIGARPGRPENGARLDLVETLRAAAPWQKVRRATEDARLAPDRRRGTSKSPSPLAGEGKGEGASWPSSAADDAPIASSSRASSLIQDGRDAPSSGRRLAPPATFSREGRREGGAAPVDRTNASPRILVRREDFRIQRLKERRKTLTIFAVDASGSAALHRLAEAKGAVELLLAEAYVRRDEVALVAFRGKGAELLLPPTRSLARAKRSLGGLPGGGGTPLASGLEAACLLAEAARRRGDSPSIVLLTDGQANVARDGSGGRARAQEEALGAAKALKALGLPCVLVDVSPRPQPRAKELAEAMAARYVALPSGDAGAIVRAAR